MIDYYGLLPSINTLKNNLKNTYISVDVAVTENRSADFTAIVLFEEHLINGEQYIYVLPQFINSSMTYPKNKDILLGIYKNSEGEGKCRVIIMECNATLKGFAQDIKYEIVRVSEFQPGNQDKGARLWGVSSYFTDKKILFPISGLDPVTKQSLGFKLFKQHDDLIDALAMIIIISSETRKSKARCFSQKPFPF